MLRHHSSLALGLAALFVLPATLPGEQDGLDLKARLEATVTAIGRLGGLEERLRAGDDSVIDELLLLTEAPDRGAEERDQQLSMLRTQLAALQQRWDELSSSGSPLRSVPSQASVVSEVTPGAVPMDPDSAGSEPLGPGHTGLDASAREQLIQALQSRKPSHSKDGDSSSSADVADGVRSFEEDKNYSADPLREGRLLARSQRWEEALTFLEPLQDDPEARYWTARCYESLGRTGEAIELLEGLVALGQADPDSQEQPSAALRTLARRAGYDLEFLNLRRELSDRRKRQEGGK